MEKEKLVQTVKLAQEGNSDALNELFNAFYNDVYYFALKNVKDEDLACDITQEAFVEIINTLGSLKEPAAFVTWMKQITYHQCTRYFKKKKEVLVDENEDGDTIFDTMTEERTEFIPDEAVDQEDFRTTIMGMIDQLPDEQRAATMMYYFDEMSVKEIAQAQGVGENTVKGRLSYSRKAIKKSVEDYEKKNNVKLHCVGLLPLLLWLFRNYGKAMPVAAAKIVAEGVSTATGTKIGVLGDFKGTATPTTAGTGANATTVPIALKITAAVAAAAVSVSAVVIGLDIMGKNTIDSTLSSQSISSTEEQVDHPSEDMETSTAYCVPKGCTYTAVTGEVYREGEFVTVPCTQGDVFTDGVYTYTYDQCYTCTWDGTIANGVWENGWVVAVIDKTATSYAPIITSINHTNVTHMYETYRDCTALITPPEIPNGIVSLEGTFQNCTALTTAPEIPDGVVRMAATFFGCASLTEAPTIPEGVTFLILAFYNCSSLNKAPDLPDSVVDMHSAFYNCTSLTEATEFPCNVIDISSAYARTAITEAPAIPDSVQLALYAFERTKIITAPVIPANVINAEFIFANCHELRGVVVINAELSPNYVTIYGTECSSTAYLCIFADERQGMYGEVYDIILTGTSSQLEEIAGDVYNISVKR